MEDKWFVFREGDLDETSRALHRHHLVGDARANDEEPSRRFTVLPAPDEGS